MERDTQRVEIERVVQGGEGLGRLSDGRVVMIPGVLPGEVVDIQLTAEHDSYASGELVDIVEASEARVTPDCRYAERCGGCQFWHTDAATQFELKVRAAEETLDRLANVETDEIERIPAPMDRRYRTHATFHRREVDDASDGEQDVPFSIGFFESASDQLVEVDDCLVAVDAVNEARRAIEPALREVGEVDLLIETADSDSCVVSVNVLHDGSEWEPPSSFGEWGANLGEVRSIRGVRVLTDRREWVLGDPTVDADQCLAHSPLESMRVPAGLFRQANPAVNRRVVDWVAEAAESHDISTVLELFSGTGNISFGLRAQLDRLVGLEVAEQAVQTANTMAQFKQLDGFEFRCRDLAAGTGEAVDENDGPFEAVVMDPPRGGAEGIVDELVANEWMARKAILYVSCDPPALARDLSDLTDGPWRLESLAAFDMFPRTSHLEMGAVLVR